MQRYRVCLNVERFIEADDADEAADQFKNDETVFYEIEAELTGKLDAAGRGRSEELSAIDGQSLRYALAEREQQLAQMIAKLQDRS
jgi:hypothetical protein